MLQISLVLCIVLAIVALQTQKLRLAVIYMGAFSITMAFVYSLFHAPDVAIAEAVIGSALATILYVVTLQKYLIFTVYFPISGIVVDDELFKIGDQSELIKRIEIFCAKEELEPQIIYTTESVAHITHEHEYSMIISALGNNHYACYSHPENYKQDRLESYLRKHLASQYDLTFGYLEEASDEA